MSEVLKVALAQYKFLFQTGFEGFKKHVLKHIEAAAKKGVDILVFPEYLTFEIFKPDSFLKGSGVLKKLVNYYTDYIDFFSKISSENNLHILAGTTVEKEGNNFFNTAHFFSPKGGTVKYRKIHLHKLDKELGFSPGDKPEVIKFSRTKIGLLICYDLGFPELSRIYALKGVEILIAPVMAPGKGAFNWLKFSSLARAIEIQGFVFLSAGLTPTIKELNLKFTGESIILSTTDYYREGVIAEGEEGKDYTVVGEINLERLRRIKNKTSAPILKDLRGEIYKELCLMNWKKQEKLNFK